MGRPHTSETKQKISEGVRKSIAKRKATTTNPSRANQLANHFASGHPDRLSPDRVRNYGDIARTEGTPPEKRANLAPQTHEEKSEVANTTAEKLGLRRASDFKKNKEGQHGGEVERPEFGAEGLSDVELSSVGLTPTKER